MSNFLQAYFETTFVGEPLPANFPARFAIISACAPTGVSWPEARNQLADQQLRVRVNRWKPHRITGRSRDGCHAEPGWAVPCSKRTALGIAREFGQDAFFWVETDEVRIVDSSRNRETESAGSFNGKFVAEVGLNAAPSWRPLVIGEKECAQFVGDTGLGAARRDLLFIGEGGDSPYHQWKLGYWILTDAKRGVRALEEADFPCGNDGETDNDNALVPGSRIVALLIDSSATLADAAQQLFEVWSVHKEARHIDGICESSKLGEATLKL